jgi:hypothetical protein
MSSVKKGQIYEAKIIAPFELWSSLVMGAKPINSSTFSLKYYGFKEAPINI